MNKISNFIKLFFFRINIIVIFIAITASFYLAYFVISPKSDDLYEARYSWEIIRIPPLFLYEDGGGADLSYKDGHEFFIKRYILAVNPEKIHRMVNNTLIFSQAKDFNCNIDWDDWVRGKFEIRPSKGLGVISIRFNEFSKENINNCKNFFYQIFLVENFKVLDELAEHFKYKLYLIDNNIERVVRKINNITYNETYKNIDILTASKLNDVLEELRIKQSNLKFITNQVKKIDRKLILVDELLEKSRSLDLLPGLVFSILLGILFSIISILILDFKKFKKIHFIK